MRQQRRERGHLVKHLHHRPALRRPADREHLTVLVHAHDSPLGRDGMHDPETVAVKQRVELGPQWAKAAGLDLHELSVSADQVDHEPADRHLQRPIAFLCAEYGVHQSLPISWGAEGALAGDLLKEASDRALPLVAVGLMYRQGYFRQRLEVSGWQQEYWIDIDPKRLPAALVRAQQRRIVDTLELGPRRGRRESTLPARPP